METTPKGFFNRIDRKLMLAFLAMAALFALVEVSYIMQLDSIAKPLGTVVQNDISSLKSASHLNSLAQLIQYYDEVLTQSARNYAFTSDKKWKSRYLSFEPELDSAIKQAIAEGDAQDQKYFSSVDAANTALVAMEHQSLDLVDKGQAGAAITILESNEYARQKAIYEQGLRNYVQRQGSNYDEASILSTNGLQAVISNIQVQISSSTNLMIISVIAIAVLLVVAGNLITRSIYNPLQQLRKAADELEQGNYAARVRIKTGDELEELGDAFNKVADSLGKTAEERMQVDKAKTQFLSITSHELRSPMTPMKAQLQMLEQGYLGKMNRAQKESLGIVVRNADRLDKILVDFLEISRIEAARLKFEFRKTDLAKTTRDVIDFMEGYVPEKRIRIKGSIKSLPIIDADADRVSQVLRNLIGNAVKFSPDNGTVEVGARVQGKFILFSVKDHGMGISPENQKKLFEPFFQVDKTFSRAQQGTGLGLAICRGIVESQDGKIWLESAEGKGTTFYFTVPFEPVREIKPIRVLFSAKSDAERKASEAFKEFLGPMGEQEFMALQAGGKMSKKGLAEYIDGLREKGIISEEEAKGFRNAIPENV